ncbi:MAG TPA: UbiA family prenyltransferase [Planctomycetaceae bacterium]|nr:UbiA family prenyltransferase [Planctomycetaceae bacterium]
MSTLRTYAQLCRLPAVFTAMADVFMGYFVARGGADVRSVCELAALVTCSSCLYLAGMVLNDVFDRDVDLRERPHRPIPSGRVSLARAVAFAAALITCGLIATRFTGFYEPGFQTVLIALLLLGAILFYDGWAKKTPIGPIAMGACRFLNVLLGAGVHSADMRVLFHREATVLALGLGIYVAGVTWFAKKEAEVSGRAGLIFGQSVLNLGLILLALWIAPQMQPVWQSHFDRWWFNASFDSTRPLVMLGLIAVVVNRRALAAMGDPRPAMVQSAVRIMLLSIITIDATLIYAALGDAGVSIALGVVSLLIPSFLLGRWMTMT